MWCWSLGTCSSGNQPRYWTASTNSFAASDFTEHKAFPCALVPPKILRQAMLWSVALDDRGMLDNNHCTHHNRPNMLVPLPNHLKNRFQWLYDQLSSGDQSTKEVFLPGQDLPFSYCCLAVTLARMQISQDLLFGKWVREWFAHFSALRHASSEAGISSGGTTTSRTSLWASTSGISLQVSAGLVASCWSSSPSTLANGSTCPGSGSFGKSSIEPEMGDARCSGGVRILLPELGSAGMARHSTFFWKYLDVFNNTICRRFGWFRHKQCHVLDPFRLDKIQQFIKHPNPSFLVNIYLLSQRQCGRTILQGVEHPFTGQIPFKPDGFWAWLDTPTRSKV